MTTTTPTLQTKLVELPLGQAGLDYVRTNLQNRTTFSQEVSSFVAKDGNVSAVVPEGTNMARALQFDRGGLVSRRFTNRWLIDRMMSNCRAHPEGMLIFDEPWGGRKHDPAIKTRKAPMFFHNDFVFHFVEGKGANERAIDAPMREGGGFLFIAAFSLYPFDASKLPVDLTIQDDQVMRDIAAQTLEIYVSAYDHESYVVWQRA